MENKRLEPMLSFLKIPNEIEFKKEIYTTCPKCGNKLHITNKSKTKKITMKCENNCINI